MLTKRKTAYSSSCFQTVSLYLAISSQFSSFLECALQLNIAKMNKTPLFWKFKIFQSHRCDTTKKLVTSVCCDRQHAYAYLQLFYERLAYNGKITTFTGVPLFDAIVCAGFLEPRKSRLGPLKSTFNAENFVRSFHLN